MSRSAVIKAIIAAAVVCAAAYGLSQVDWGNALGSAIEFVQAQQRVFHDLMAKDLRAIKDTNSPAATFALITVGFIYGLFHALGPCHDKMVITGYMLANERSLRRGMIITAAAAFLQAFTAMVLVLGLYYLLGFARYQAERIASWLEMGSFVFVALLGLGLIAQSIREIWRQFHPAAHMHDEHCGHEHMPDAQKVARAKNWGELAIITLSIGIRPCSGAILLLVFACILGAVWSGIAATLAMALGSAIMTAVLALAAVQSKNLALRFFKFSEKDLALTHAALGILGGIIILLMGGFFLLASWQEIGASPNAATITTYDHPLMGMHPAQR